MKTLILILIIFAFLQSTFLPIDLILIVLICRSFIKSDTANLYLAFGFGLLISFLNLYPLGLESILYLLIVQATQILSKSRLTSNSLFIVPITLMFLILNQFVLSVIINQSINLFPNVLLESIIALPTFFLVRLWEERFIIRKNIKLRV